jgi:hypothetical protein
MLRIPCASSRGGPVADRIQNPFVLGGGLSLPSETAAPQGVKCLEWKRVRKAKALELVTPNPRKPLSLPASLHAFGSDP